jgi:hypothetical protein
MKQLAALVSYYQPSDRGYKLYGMMVVRMALLSSSDQWNFWQQSMRGEIGWHWAWVVLICS